MTQARAIYVALAAFFGWVLTDVAIKLAAQRDLPPTLIMGVLGLVGALGLATTATARGRLSSLRPTRGKAMLMVAAASVGINYTNVIALKHLPLTLFYILVFTAPFFIAALSVFVQHEALTKKKIACLVAGFVGVVIAVGGREVTGGDLLGYAAAFASVLFFAIYTVVIRHVVSETGSTSILFANAASCALCGFGASWMDVGLLDGQGVVLLVGCGLANLASNALYNKALKHTASSNVAQIHYTQIISGALLGFLIWGEVPTVNLLIGGALIILSGLVVAAQAHSDDQTA
jgi:drug/metabolite transporter (DMT)-like permease